MERRKTIERKYNHIFDRKGDDHATDPAGGRLVNAFDLVRLHKFADLDDGAPDGAKGNRLPSWAAMCELARCEGSVLSEDIMNLALKAFGVQVRRNLIASKTEITGMPAAYSREEAVNTLPQFLADRLRAMGIRGVNRTTIDACLANISDTNRYNPVLDMLDSTIWDGESRFSDLLRILGISPVSLYAVLVRKWLIQSVAMAHNEPGRIQAAEGVLTLQGAQGQGKT